MTTPKQFAEELAELCNKYGVGELLIIAQAEYWILPGLMSIDGKGSEFMRDCFSAIVEQLKIARANGVFEKEKIFKMIIYPRKTN